MTTKYRIPNKIWLMCMTLKHMSITCPEGHLMNRVWYPEVSGMQYRDCVNCTMRYGIGQLKLQLFRHQKPAVKTSGGISFTFTSPSFRYYTAASDNSLDA